MARLKGMLADSFVTLSGRDWNEMIADLASQLDGPQGAALSSGEHAWLEAADCPPSISDLERLVWLLELHHVKLDGWKDTEDKAGRHSAPEKVPSKAADGAKTVGSQLAAVHEEPSLLQERDRKVWTEAAFVSRTLRSGQFVRHGGSVVVLGDVNPGAVIIADGSVIVWGRLRGVVHAGAGGDENAVVCALELAPAQLRIGGHVARAPDVNNAPAVDPELARVRHGQIVIGNWDDEKE